MHSQQIRKSNAVFPRPTMFLSLAPVTAPVPRTPSTFLKLAPSTSSGYPQPQARTVSSPVIEGLDEVQRPALHQRRSSSMSSTSGYRVLKLGPVYWGEHQEENKDDFVDLVSTPSP